MLFASVRYDIYGFIINHMVLKIVVNILAVIVSSYIGYIKQNAIISNLNTRYKHTYICMHMYILDINTHISFEDIDTSFIKE